MLTSDALVRTTGQGLDNAPDYYQQSCAAVSACQQFVRKRPCSAILITAGVAVIVAGGGVLLGRFAMRRIRAHPARFALIAAGVGFLTGHWWVCRR